MTPDLEPPLRETFAGKHLVMTGATGFVGGVWLSLLLHALPEVGRLTLLVRKGSFASAQARMIHRFETSPVFRPLREAHPHDLDAWLDARVRVLDADITRPDLGLDPEVSATLASQTDAIVHVAGLTDFQLDPAQGVPTNINGALHLAHFAQQTPHPRMLHISTAFVAGLREGAIPEQLTPLQNPLGKAFDAAAVHEQLQKIAQDGSDRRVRKEKTAAIAHALGWPNNYTLTKGLAEHLLSAQALDLCIVRPSVIECARSYPFAGWNEGLNTSVPLMGYCDSLFRALPSRGDAVFDIIPVDAVAKAATIALARLLRGHHHAVYQTTTGDCNPATFARIAELTALGHRQAVRANPDASWLDRLSQHIDIVTRDPHDLPWFTPANLATWAGYAQSSLERVTPTAWRRSVCNRTARFQRDMRRLDRMLEIYAPFIHDHAWVFSSAHTRQAKAELHPDDTAFWLDDTEHLDWRAYWLEIQEPGARRWSYPLLEGKRAPTDRPPRERLHLRASTPNSTDLREIA